MGLCSGGPVHGNYWLSVDIEADKGKYLNLESDEGKGGQRLPSGEYASTLKRTSPDHRVGRKLGSDEPNGSAGVEIEL